MSVMNYVSSEIKIIAVKHSLVGTESLNQSAARFGVSRSTLQKWLLNYEMFGTEGLCHRAGNHHYSKEIKREAVEAYPVAEWHGGKVHRVRPHVLHLIRGQIFELDGCRFFTMGGAKSHDIEDGILEPDAPDFERRLTMLQRKPRVRYRINHISWWAQELPSDEEYTEARRNLDAVGWAVDYIITHCAPTSIALMGTRHNEADRLTDFLQEVKERAKYHYWLFGHYHDNKAIDEKHILMWEQIVRVI